MNKNFILTVYPQTKSDKSSDVVRVDNEAYNIMKEIQIQTGLPAKYIVSEAIKYASERLEIIEIGEK